MKKPMTTIDFFYLLKNNLEEQGKIPDILDYAIPDQEAELKNYMFSLKTNLSYGGEGIYLDLSLEMFEGEWQEIRLGTLKTLREDDEAMKIMAQLLADFVIEEYRYVNDHLDDFEWEGADVYPLNEDGDKLGFGYSFLTMKGALRKKDALLSEYPGVWVRNNETREETVY